MLIPFITNVKQNQITQQPKEKKSYSSYHFQNQATATTIPLKTQFRHEKRCSDAVKEL